jgi:hypothetical protein
MSTEHLHINIYSSYVGKKPIVGPVSIQKHPTAG